jgi:hypothetical protein
MTASVANKEGAGAMHENKRVIVDADFARFGNKSYAINKINSVEVRARKPYGQGAMFGWGLLALICGLAGLGQLGEASGGAVITLGLAGLFGFLAYRAWGKSQIVEYQLFLMTSSSEAQAFVSRNGDEVQSLRERIEGAMARKPVFAE